MFFCGTKTTGALIIFPSQQLLVSNTYMEPTKPVRPPIERPSYILLKLLLMILLLLYVII